MLLQVVLEVELRKADVLARHGVRHVHIVAVRLVERVEQTAVHVRDKDDFRLRDILAVDLQ